MKKIKKVDSKARVKSNNFNKKIAKINSSKIANVNSRKIANVNIDRSKLTINNNNNNNNNNR